MICSDSLLGINYKRIESNSVGYKKENSTLEEDFFVRTKDALVPVEVKATNGRSKSLRSLIENEKYQDIKFGIKFCNGNIGYSNGIYTFPYFCVFLLKEYLKNK